MLVRVKFRTYATLVKRSNKWIKRRIIGGGFVENEDYINIKSDDVKNGIIKKAGQQPIETYVTIKVGGFVEDEDYILLAKNGERVVHMQH